MKTNIQLLKTEGEALGAYLLLREGLALNHGSCLCAVAVAHGHKDWNAVTALGASADVPLSCRLASRSTDCRSTALFCEAMMMSAGTSRGD
jgi:hypothetical protein